MPLKSGKSQVGKNIKELEHSYKKTGKIGTSKPKSKKAAHKQAIAIALNKAGKSKKLKESYDDAINSYLKKYLIEMDIRRDPREIEGVVDTPDIDETEQEDYEFNEWLKEKFKDRPGFLKNLPYDQDMVTDLLYDFRQEKKQGQTPNEDYEEESESSDCQDDNQNIKSDILTFYGLK